MSSISAEPQEHDTAARLYSHGIEMLAAGQRTCAERAVRRSLDFLYRSVGPSHPDTAVALNALAVLVGEREDFAQALRLTREAYTILERLGGCDRELDNLQIEVANRCSDLLRMLGHYTEAEALYKQTIRRLKHSEWHRSPALPVALNGLGVVYKYMGRITASRRLYSRALAIIEAQVDSPVLLTATLYHNLGGLEHAAGNFQRGEPYARRAVEIRTWLLGPEHPLVAADLAALAGILDGLKRFEESEPIYRQAIALLEKSRGTAIHDLAAALNNLGAVRAARGDLTEASQLYRRTLAVKRRLFGNDHPELAVTLNNLATLQEVAGRRAVASRLYRRALEIFEDSLGPSHPSTLACRRNLAVAATDAPFGRQAPPLPVGS